MAAESSPPPLQPAKARVPATIAAVKAPEIRPLKPLDQAHSKRPNVSRTSLSNRLPAVQFEFHVRHSNLRQARP